MDVRQFAFLAGQPSAALKNREQFWGLPKRGLAFILANAMFWQPLLVQADGIVVSAPGTTLGQAGNGVPIVNIAAPNAQGLSHNQFTDYNVGANGVILNNATSRTQSTQLGGIILGNQNLNGTSANIILNEVNGASPSQLRGYTEVAGQSAHVIVANPYGISCNGCGFINTPQATLTTGKPVISNGQLTGYQVDRGSVSIEGAGLNANNIDQFEIITRSAKLNAEINAKKLAIIAGANDVDAKTLKATARAANPADAPQLAIDSSALGGMYAGAIRLVGTEAGVGVKLDGKMVASGGDIQLDANGHLSMVETGASGAIDVKAASLEAKGPVYAGTTLDVKTQGDLTSQNNLVAKDRITLNSGGQLTNNGIIEAGVNADKTRNGMADVNLTAQNIVNNGQSVIASRDLNVTATQALSNQGGTLSGQRKTTVVASTLDNQSKGRVISADTLNLTADTVLNAQGGLIKGQNVLIANLGHLNNNAGEVSSQGNSTLILGSMDNLTGLVMANNVLDITATGAVNNQNGRLGSNNIFTFKGQSLDNTQKGRITAQQSLDLTATHLDNTGGSVITNGPLNLTADTVDNATGRISSQGDLTANVTTFNQQDGALVTDGNLTLTGSTLDNRNAALISAKKLLTLNVGAIDNRAGEISSVQAVNLNGQSLNNSEGGKVLSDTALGLKVAQVINQSLGQLVSQGSTTLTGSSLDNSGGKLSAQSGLVITLDGALTNQLSGLISSEGTLTAHAASLDNSGGSFSSAGQLSLTSDGALINQGGRLVTDGGIDLHSASLDNRYQGTISGQGPVSINTGNFDNSHSGFLSSADHLDLTTAQLTNQDGGRIGAAKALTATVSGLDQQGGELKSDTSVALDLNHGQLNNQGGVIRAPLLVLSNLKDVNNQGGEISSAQAFTLAAASLNNDNGQLLSNQPLTLRIDQALSNIKGMIAAAAVDVRAGSLDNTTGTLSSRAGLELTVDGQLINQNLGLISATNGLTLNSAGLNNQSGRLQGSAITLDLANGDLNNAVGHITTDGQLSINRLRDLNNQGGELTSAQSLNLTGRTLDNSSSGKLISNNQLTLTADNLINQNAGLLSGWQGVTINAGSLDNRNSGTVSSRSGNVGVTLSGALLNGNAGAVASQQALTIKAGSLDNSAGALSSAGAQSLTITGLLNNGQGGLIDAGTLLTLNAMALNNSGTVQAKQALSFTGTDLDNSNGILSSGAAVTLDLLGTLTNTKGKLSSVSPLVVQRSSQINNQGGELSSQSLLTLLTGGLDSSNGGLVSANDKLLITSTGAVQNGNGGLIASRNGDLQLTATSLGNGKGSLQGKGAVILDVSGDIDNQSGKVIAQDGDLTLKATNVDSRGGLLSSISGALTTRVVGVLKNGYDLNNNREGGLIQAQRLDLQAWGGLDNYGGRIAAQAGDALIATGAGDFDNRNGAIHAKGLVQVSGNNFDNSGDNDGQISGSQINLNLAGALNNRLGIIESDSTLSIAAASLDNQTGQLRALGTSGKTQFQIGGLLDNRNGQLETANTDLTLNTGSFLNQGGSLLHVGNGTFDTATANITNAGGSFITRGGLTLTADSWTNSSVIQAGRLTLNIGTLNQTAGGQLLASTSLTGTGGNWNNDGLIASDGTASLNLSGNYSGNGRYSSLGTLGLTAASVSLGNTGSIAGGGDTTINVGGVLNNYGRLTSAANMSVGADAINNYGTLGSAQILTATTGALLNDHGLIFSGSDMGLRLDSLTNSYGNIYSLGNLKIDRDGLGGLASSIVNSSGSIQSDGSMSLAASTIKNVRAVLTTNNQGIYTASITETQCIEDFNASDCSDGKMNHVWQITQRDKFEVTEASAASSITAGTHLSLQGGDLLNQSSSIAAGGSFSAQVNNLTNSGLETGETETSRIFVSERTRHPEGWYANAAAFTNQYWFQSAGYNPNNLGGLQAAMSAFIGSAEREWVQLRTTRKLVTGDQSYAAVIQAGGAVNVQAQNGIDNSVVRPGYTYVGAGPRTDTQSSGSNFSTRITVNSQLPPDLAQQQVNPTTLPGFALPTGQNGLFHLSGQSGSAQQGAVMPGWSVADTSMGIAQRQQGATAVQARSVPLSGADSAVTASAGQSLARVLGLPDTSGRENPQKYLIETSPVLTDLKQFMSSDYLLSNLGYDPDASAKRLGDGFYEQKLIQQAVTSRTGQRFIDGQTSDDAMFKYLMNNAIASKQALNLQLGVSLTSEQVAALTHDIVWMENQTVNGEQVLVPVLYLANANNRLAANGALIQGSDVSLIAGKDLNNAGTLRASNNLSATAGNDMVNSGLLEATNRLDALANNNLTNKAGGIIAGRDVSVTATTGDVVNERTITTHESGVGDKSEQRGFADSAAGIEASNNLAVSAGRDIDNSGGVLKSTLDTTLKAGRDVNITSAEQVNGQTLGDRYSDKSVIQNGSSVTAGRDLAVSAGRDLTAIASHIDAKRDVALSAVGDLTLASAADEQHSFVKTDKVTSQEDHTQQVSTGVTAGGSVALVAGKDLEVTASRVSAGNEAYLYAGNDLNLNTAQNSDYSYYSKTKKGAWGKKSSTMTESGSEQAVSSGIQAQGKATIVAVNDVNITGSTVNSDKGALVVRAGNDVNLSAAQNSQFNASAESKSGGFGFSSTSKMSSDSSSSTSLTGATLSADSTLIQAGHDLTVSASNVVSTEETNLQARNDIRIESGTENFSAQHSQSTKKSGLMGSGGIGVTLGSSKNAYTQSTESQMQKASTVGSVLGSVSITAGKDLSVKASDVVADKDINLAGQNVYITDAANGSSTQTTQESSKSGLTLALSGVVGEAVNTAVQTVQASKQEDDSRLAALQGVKAGLSGYQAWQGAQAIQSGASTGSFVGIALSLGTQKSSSKQIQEQSTSQGGSLTAGKDLNIVAVGNGQPGSATGDIAVIGGKLQAGHDVSMTAARDIDMGAGVNTQRLDGSNTSGGGAIGISLGVGSSGAGLSIFANANSGTGKETGNGSAWTETTVNAGNQLTLKSGRDTTLEGAQATAQKVIADIGRNLTLTSLQDTDRFNSKQANASAGGSFTFGSMTGSASLSVSQDKIKSNFESVQEQTGLFAGKGGYQVNVGEHTQLNGSVIASTASADQNKLSTGTLGWTGIRNEADFSSQHQSVSGGTGGDTGSTFLGNMGSLLLTGANHSGHDSSTTYSAVSAGEINIRDQGKQQQDVATLSRDVEHANNALSPIFDKEKEQKRLRQAQLIGEIGNQAVDIIRTQGAIETAKALKDPQKIEAARQQLAQHGNINPTNEQISTQVTNTVLEDYGTGGNYQRAAQAVTAAIQGLAGGNVAQALVGASAPYLAGVIKASTGDNLEARLMAHAVLGAVLAKSQQTSALAGAAGASLGELIATQLYPGKLSSELSEVEKQKISTLSTLAGGLVGGLVGGDSASAVAGGSAAKNAVENNEVSFPLNAGYGAAAASLDAYLVQQGATPEQRSEALRSQARGDGYEGPGHDFVAGWVYASGGVGAAVVLPELAMGCALAPVICNEAAIIAAEMAGGDAALGGTAFGVFGGGALALKNSEKGIEIAPGKFDYLFGRVDSNSHNAARSNQLALEMKRLGVPDNAAGRQMLTDNLTLSAKTEGNVIKSFTNQYGIFEVRESLFVGPSGQAANFQSTFQVLDDGTRKLSTLIPLH